MSDSSARADHQRRVVLPERLDELSFEQGLDVPQHLPISRISERAILSIGVPGKPVVEDYGLNATPT